MSKVLVRKADAEKVLAEVKRIYAVEADDPSQPTLVQDFDWLGGSLAPYAVVWEEGPYDWALLATSGGVDQELTSLMAGYLKPGAVIEREAIKQPDGVFCEPITAWALGIYEGG